MFIVLEGIDGSGKSTIAKMITEYYIQKGDKVFLTEEPTISWIGKCVKEAVKNNEIPEVQTLLFMADRIDHIKEIKKKLAEGYVVVCDRFIFSTYAYQGVLLKDKFNSMENAMSWMEKIYGPFKIDIDMVFLLDVNPVDGIKRIEKRKNSKEQFEKVDMLNKVRESYLFLSERYGMKKITADEDIEVVWGEIKSVLETI